MKTYNRTKTEKIEALKNEMEILFQVILSVYLEF